jgi:hypothetical protein
MPNMRKILIVDDDPELRDARQNPPFCFAAGFQRAAGAAAGRRVGTASNRRSPDAPVHH